MKKRQLFAAVTALVLLFTGCNSNGTTTSSDTSAASSTKEASTSTAVSMASGEDADELRQFVDSAGREVDVPQKITKIAPSGSLAQLVLYTSSPDLLVGLAHTVSDTAKPYIGEKYQDLPEFGQFYGKNASLNMEALSAAKPDVIIDVGEAKKTIKEDMDKLQEQLQIPVVFIEANLENLSETYQRLGELLGDKKGMQELSDYCEKVLAQAEKVRGELTEDEQKSVYYASGDAGLNTSAEGSFHAQVFDTIGAKNAATGIEVVSSGTGTVVSMEQLIQWQPDYILAATDAVYQLIQSDESWQELEAVKAGHVYLTPSAPYNFLGYPPSVNRLLGIQWLGQLMYPDHYQLDTEKAVTEYYELFYHMKPTSSQLSEILKDAV